METEYKIILFLVLFLRCIQGLLIEECTDPRHGYRCPNDNQVTFTLNIV